MSITVRCEKCQQWCRVAESFANKQVRCPQCKEVFTARRWEDEVATNVKAGSKLMHPAAAPMQLGQAVPLEVKSCPTCKAKLPSGTNSCGECGWTSVAFQAEKDTPDKVVICSNVACGVANPMGQRRCARCQAMLPSAPGEKLFSRYRIEKLLATGGFGAVYLAMDEQTKRKVAIKDMLSADAQEFEQRIGFFRREAEILKLLHTNPIVPRFVEFREEPPTACLVMEYIPGKDLMQVLESRGHRAFTAEQVLPWAVSICDVLTQMHSQQPPLIHRDLKPDNIMLLEDGHSIRLIDFGTARDIGKNIQSRVAFKTKVYTEGYAPPEQVIGKPEVRSDLFALAGTLFHLLTGKSPEGYYTATEIREQLASPGCSYPENQKWLMELVAINLSEDPHDRYLSAREIKTDLQKKQITREAVCPQCRHINQARDPYCLQCASPLTANLSPCLQCGKVNRIGSRYCVGCGIRIK